MAATTPLTRAWGHRTAKDRAGLWGAGPSGCAERPGTSRTPDPAEEANKIDHAGSTLAHGRARNTRSPICYLPCDLASFAQTSISPRAVEAASRLRGYVPSAPGGVVPPSPRVLGPDTSRPCVLVIEDDPAYARLLRLNLEASRYQVAHAHTGLDGLAQLAHLGPSLVMLDLTLPDIDGHQVCQQIREQSDVPVIIVTARRQEQNLIQGLLSGADDYITKPFSVDELLARVSTVLRRARAREKPGRPAVLRVGDLLIDFVGHRVTRMDQEVMLTALEFKLLTTLASNAGRVVVQDELLRSVWGAGREGDVAVLRTTVRQLRNKLGDCEEECIRNMRAVGYMFVKPPPPPRADG